MVDSLLAGVCGGARSRKELERREFVLGRGRGFGYIYKFANILRIRPCLGAAGEIVGGVWEINLWRW